MKKVRILMALAICVAMIAACSGNKKSNVNSSNEITEKDIAGYYLGFDEYENWSCNINEDGTGYELAKYSNNSIQISVPFKWTIKDNEITFSFIVDEASLEGDTESEIAQAIVSSAMAGYSEPRVCKIETEGNNITINGEGLYPTYTKLME